MATSVPTVSTQPFGTPGLVGPPDPAGTYLARDVDGSRVRVTPMLIRSYAGQATQEAKDKQSDRQALDSANLTGSPFGAIAAGREAQVAYHVRFEAGRTELADLASVLQTFGERLREAATRFEKQDEDAAAQLAFQIGALADQVICR